MLTIDASVWLSANSAGESNHATSRALLDHITAGRLPIILPTLLLVEVAGAISRTSGNSAVASKFSDALRGLTFARWISLDDSIAEQAAMIAATRFLRGADALYAAVALAHGCDLISLDREHLTRLPSVLRTLTPAEALARFGVSQNP